MGGSLLMRRSKLITVIAGLLLVVVPTGCRYKPETNTWVAWTYDDSRAAIQQAFGPYGQEVVDKATRVATCESGLWPYSGTNKPGYPYHGIFQLGKHIVAIHAYGGNRTDPYQNALAARDLWLQRGNWSAWPHCGYV